MASVTFLLKVRPKGVLHWTELKFEDVEDLVTVVGLQSLAHAGTAEMQVHKKVGGKRPKEIILPDLMAIASELLVMQGNDVQPFVPEKTKS